MSAFGMRGMDVGSYGAGYGGGFGGGFGGGLEADSEVVSGLDRVEASNPADDGCREPLGGSARRSPELWLTRRSPTERSSKLSAHQSSLILE